MAVVLGEFDIVELPAEMPKPPSPPAAAPIDALEPERQLLKLLQREQRCFAD